MGANKPDTDCPVFPDLLECASIHLAVDELPFGNKPSPPKLLIYIVPIEIHESSSVFKRSRSYRGLSSAARSTAVLDNGEKGCAISAVK